LSEQGAYTEIHPNSSRINSKNDAFSLSTAREAAVAEGFWTAAHPAAFSLAQGIMATNLIFVVAPRQESDR